MANATGPATISSVNFYLEETNATTALGSLAQTQDGRRFRYVLAGATSLVVGDLQQSQVESTNFKDMTIQAAAAVGATSIAVTLGSTATAVTASSAGNLIGGLAVISSATGLGQYSRVLTHDTASANATCNFTLEDPLITALTTSNLVTIYPSPFRNIIIHPGGASTGISAGVAVRNLTTVKYGWLQTGGLGACLGDATASTAAAQAVSPSVSTPGCVTRAVTLAERVGTSYPVLTVSARVEPVWLEID